MRIGHDPASRYFAKGLTSSERAAFEAGIALATALHQFVGMPLPRDDRGIRLLERTIERVLLAQPYRSRAEVKVRRTRGKRWPYDYGWLDPRGFSVEISVRYDDAEVRAVLRWIDELEYPLMYIERVKR